MVLEKLVGSAVGYLASSIKKSKGGEKASDEITTAIWNWISPIFLKEEEKKEELQKFEEEPESSENQKAIAQSVTEHLKQNPEEAKQLEVLVEKAKTKYPERMGDVHNYGNVEKQVNNPIIKGDFNM